MLSIFPIKRAVVPETSAVAAAVAAPNYDEFQRDADVVRYIEQKPKSVLRVTMPHCDVTATDGLSPSEGSAEALERARATLAGMLADAGMRRVEGLLFIYTMVDPTRAGVQIGLGGLAARAQIRTEANPDGVIIRNEGIYRHKMLGRAALIQATQTFTDIVNLVVDDEDGGFAEELERWTQAHPVDYEVVDHKGNTHRVHLVTEAAAVERLRRLLGDEPRAYVADGNHRSAAACELGSEGFLAVFFPASRMRIDPYHRLVQGMGMSFEALCAAAADTFTATPLGDAEVYQPEETHRLGAYWQGRWYRLDVREEAYDPDDAVQTIDADVLQRRVFHRLLGIADPTDKRLTFVGGDKGAGYLKAEVDAGRAELGIAMPAVTMRQFVDVCLQGRFMPPKSTWFEPKLLSGVVFVLLDQDN